MISDASGLQIQDLIVPNKNKTVMDLSLWHNIVAAYKELYSPNIEFLKPNTERGSEYIGSHRRPTYNQTNTLGFLLMGFSDLLNSRNVFIPERMAHSFLSLFFSPEIGQSDSSIVVHRRS